MKFEKIFWKITFSFPKVNFSLLGKNIFLKKVDFFFYFRSHERSELLAHVYYELLKPGETVNTIRYCQQMINLNDALIKKRPEWARRHSKVILQHNNAPAYSAKVVKETISSLGWELLPHPPYSPDLAPCDYHLFSSMGHSLAQQHLKDFEDVRK